MSRHVGYDTEWKVEPSGAVAWTLTSRDCAATPGSGRRKSASMSAKTVVLAAIPPATVATTTMARPGVRRKLLSEWRRSWNSDLMARPFSR